MADADPSVAEPAPAPAAKPAAAPAAAPDAAAAAAADEASSAVPAQHPVKIIDIDPVTKEFTADADALAGILQQPEVADLPVVVVSIAGKFREGKSFMLNFFLRFLNFEGENEAEWLGDLDQALEGFTWRHGAKRETTGLWMWSKAFVRTIPGSGKKVAVVLVDTQGTFDNKTTMHENATIFALNSILSSYQVYNVSKLISEDVLTSMSLFTKLGMWIFDNQRDQKNPVTPFQKIRFLVRDWQYPEDNPYGEEGGEAYLKEVMQTEEGEGNEELRLVRRDIMKCFDKMDCYLFPHPGTDVAESRNFKGAVTKMRDTFRAELQKFVPSILSSTNLVPKKFLGQEVTCSGLQSYIMALVEVLKGDEVPIMKNAQELLGETAWKQQKEMMLKHYRGEMRDVTKASHPYVEPKEFDQIHARALESAVEGYRTANLTASESHFNRFLADLEAEIASEYEQFAEDNRNKALINTLRTPITLGSLAFGSHIICTILSVIGLSSIGSMFSLVTWVSMLTVMFWGYCHFSGQYPDVVVNIDQFSKWLFEIGQALVLQHYFGIAPPAPAAPSKKKD